MQMTNDEIVMRYKQAKSKGDQVQILAELNDCPVERIIGILVSAGIDNRNFNRLRKKLRLKEEQAVNEAVEAVKEFDVALRKGEEIEEQAKVFENVELPPMTRSELIENGKEIAQAIAKAQPKESSEPEETPQITVKQALSVLTDTVSELVKQRDEFYKQGDAVDEKLCEIGLQLTHLGDAIAGRG